MERTETSLMEVLFLCLCFWGTHIYKASNFCMLSYKAHAGKEGVFLGSGMPCSKIGKSLFPPLLYDGFNWKHIYQFMLNTCSLVCGTILGRKYKASRRPFAQLLVPATLSPMWYEEPSLPSPNNINSAMPSHGLRL